jgi:hypothetical protein
VRTPTRTQPLPDTATAARNCPYAGNKSGWPEQLTRFAPLPTEAAQYIIDEYVCLALTPRSGLFGLGKSLITRLHRDQVTEPIALAVARMKTMPWAIYRVRRLYCAPANAIRSVDSVLLGGHRTVHTALTEVSRLVDIPLTNAEVGQVGHLRRDDLQRERDRAEHQLVDRDAGLPDQRADLARPLGGLRSHRRSTLLIL